MRQGNADNRLLILSDGKPGHLNQSIAFARHSGRDYDICRVRFKNRFAKLLSYLADRSGIYLAALFAAESVAGNYAAIVSAGSETYYANRVIAKKLGCKSVAIMLPKGYRYAFDLIVAQQHDTPPPQDNIVSLPINLTFIEPKGLVRPQQGKQYVSLIVGGNSRYEKLAVDWLKKQITRIIELFPDHEFWLTTSRRTPAEVEAMLQEFRYARAIYYSQEAINPIPDFLQHSDYVFLTSDSTSMISEAVSFGTAGVEILSAAQGNEREDKYRKFLKTLLDAECLHLFEGRVGNARAKIDIAKILAGVAL